MDRLDKRELIDEELKEEEIIEEEESIEEPETEEEESEDTFDVDMSEDGEMDDPDEDDTVDDDNFYIVKHRGEEKRIPKDDEKVMALLSKGLEMDTYKQEYSSDIELINTIKSNPKAIQALQNILSGKEEPKSNKVQEPDPEQIVDNQDQEDDEDEILMTKSEIVNVLKDVLNGEYGLDEIKRAREYEASMKEYDTIKQSLTVDIPGDKREAFSNFLNNTLELLPDQIVETLAKDKQAYVDYVNQVKGKFFQQTDTKRTQRDTVPRNDTNTGNTGNTGKRKKAPIQKSSTSVKAEQSSDIEPTEDMTFDELKKLARKKQFKLSDIVGN